MREVQRDCRDDAEALDHTAFTPKGVGVALGSTLAMLATVAEAVALLDELYAGLSRTVASRTDHLA